MTVTLNPDTRPVTVVRDVSFTINPGEIVGMVVRDGLKLAMPGIGIGAAGALLLTRFMRTMLYQVTPTNPVIYGELIALILVVATAASFIPARRAASLDPARALREE